MYYSKPKPLLIHGIALTQIWETITQIRENTICTDKTSKIWPQTDPRREWHHHLLFCKSGDLASSLGFAAFWGLPLCKLLGIILPQTRRHSSAGRLPIAKFRMGLLTSPSLSFPRKDPKTAHCFLLEATATKHTYLRYTVNLQYILRTFFCSSIP